MLIDAFGAPGTAGATYGKNKAQLIDATPSDYVRGATSCHHVDICVHWAYRLKYQPLGRGHLAR